MRAGTLAKVAPLLGRMPDWQALLDSGMDDKDVKRLRRHERTGRPLGSDGFVGKLEMLLGRPLRPQRRGPKPGGKVN